jgi:hypothetical protein
MRRWLTAITTILAVGVTTTAYVRQPAPRSALGDAVGVRRSRPFDRFCGWFVRDARLGTWPTGKVVCAWYRPVTTDRVAELDQLSYHALTRRVSLAERSWAPLSDAAWRRDVDSVRTALRAQGGVPSCSVWTYRTPNVIREYWRFPEFEIKLFTGADTNGTPISAIRTPRWFLFLRGVPGRMSPCKGFPDPP